MTTGYIFLPEQGGGGGSGITSINGDTSSSQIIAGGTGISVASSGGVTTITNTAPVPTGGNNTFAGFDGSGALESIPGWNFDPTYSGAQVSSQGKIINDGFHYWNSFNLQLDPSIASPADTWGNFALQTTIDPNSTGLAIGTDGQAIRSFDSYIVHNGTSNVGSIVHMQLECDLGNGTDPVTVGGFSYCFGFGNFHDNVTIDGLLQGYSFQPSLTSAVSTTANFGVTVFADFANLPVKVYGYNAFISNPNVGIVANNHSFNAFTSGGTITTLEGNAGYTGFGLFPTITTLGTSGFSAIDANPIITTQQPNSGITGYQFSGQVTTMGASANLTGYNMNTQITTAHGFVGGYQANPQITGGDADVTLYQGNVNQVTTTSTNVSVLNLSGLTADGKQSAFNADNVRANIGGVMVAADNQGVQSQHVIFTQYSTPNAAITGTDILMNILSPDVDFGPVGGSVALGPSGLGTNMVAFAGQLHGHGSMVQLNSLLAGAIFAEDFTLGEFRDVNSVMINAGYTGTCTNATAFYHEIAGAGPFATNHWGLRIVSDIDNFVTRMAVNTPTQKVTNASVGLEVAGNDRVLLISRMTTTEKNALTAVNGMLVYDTTLDKFQGFEAGAWVNLV